jgi:pimeloyl-ACP methyl ester carboxylesterase
VRPSRLTLCFLIALALSACARVKAEASPCDSLQKLQLANTTITNARVVSTGAFQMPRRGARASVEFFNSFNTLRAFCRVQATVSPSTDSHINVEVWLPVTDWNGRFLGLGNGGYGGSIAYYRLGEAVNGGYAAGSTDTGHRGSSRDSRWAIGHPEKQTDFDYRAVHEMTVVARAAIEAFYTKTPSHSYFSSCSNGGRQGLMEAERYPTDYDGIMAGAPAMHWGFRTFLTGNLETFRARGGKVVIYHGSADAPQNSVEYLNQQRSHFGANVAEEFIQLYVVPGMGHCGSGDVPNDFGQWVRPNADAQNSMLKALERWVEDSVRPQSIIATQWKREGDTASGVLRTMPLCPYPQRAGSDRQCH